GSCTGTCQLEVGASCEGTCRGECDGECSVVNASGQCEGQCMGMCEGSCELAAGGSCEGSCEGSCTYTPPEGMCEASATAKCRAMADASVQCEGRCEGTVEPPQVSAECQATVDAKAKASVECTPPSLQVNYQFAAGLDAQGRAEFKAWMQNFRNRLSALIAASTKAGIVLEAGQGLIAAGGTAVTNAAAEIQASGDIVASYRAGSCAIPELRNVGTALQGAVQGLQFSVDAFVQIGGAVDLNQR